MDKQPAFRSLLFVYNADSGLFNTITDIAHKILAPDSYTCDLCALTHGHFRVREEWVAFLETLPVSCEFLHRDEFRARYPAQADDCPVIFRITERGLDLFASREDIAQCADLAALRTMILERLDVN